MQLILIRRRCINICIGLDPPSEPLISFRLISLDSGRSASLIVPSHDFVIYQSIKNKINKVRKINAHRFLHEVLLLFLLFDIVKFHLTYLRYKLHDRHINYYEIVI